MILSKSMGAVMFLSLKAPLRISTLSYSLVYRLERLAVYSIDL